MDIEGKIKALRAKYPDEESALFVNEWEKKLKLSKLTANLKNHDGMKIILEGMTEELAKIKKTLSEDELLFKNEEGIMLGRMMHERQKWIKSFLKTFDRAESQVKGIGALIDNKLLNDNQDR